MNEQGRQTGSFGDELTNAAMIGLVVLFGVALILRAAGSVAAFLTGTPQPAGDPASGVGVLFRPGDPGSALDADGLNSVVYWIVAGLLLAGLATGFWDGPDALANLNPPDRIFEPAMSEDRRESLLTQWRRAVNTVRRHANPESPSLHP